MAAEEEVVDSVETEGVAIPAKLRPETYGLDGTVPFDKWLQAHPDEIWPRSRFGLKPPDTVGECAYNECNGFDKPNAISNNSDKPVKKSKLKNPEKFMCMRCNLKYCSAKCRKKCKSMHDISCDGDSDPRDVELFILTHVNDKRFANVAGYANDIFVAAMVALADCPILKPGFEPYELERSENQTEEEFHQCVHIAFLERVRHAIGRHRLNQTASMLAGTGPSPPEELLPPTTSVYAGANLFILVALATGGRRVVHPLGALVAHMLKYVGETEPLRGFSFLSMETGHLAPGLLTSEREGLTFDKLFLRDLQFDVRMSTAYLIILSSARDPTRKRTVLTSLLWRSGAVSRLHHALPFHYSLGEWMNKDESKVDKFGYASKYMTTDTVLKHYIPDLAVLTSKDTVPSRRRQAFCNVFGVHPKNLVAKHVGGTEEGVLPEYALTVCRVFAF